ncbi:MAG: DNA polymerase III subunit gamma/tau [Ideonella sp.]|nr:DNA polymerase III subunit gamma/tau [Ideonella sp.]MCC7456065.1 DNA polymerase III subunit gamma/tau [Nitrospira sp.]
MGSMVLARKYRPRRFAEMVGQEHVVRALGNALASGRLHHAYLFTGTRGIGKTTVSRILAKSLNCTGPDGNGGVTAEPCGRCQACTEIDADRYIDYIELDAASNRGIEEARELIERAAYKPSVGRFKVFMIDEAHQLTKDAFSALLKTLEEPPEYLKFVLATTDPDKMLPTVLSRCLQFNLRPMAPQTVAEYLERVLQAEGVAHDAGALRLLARGARGSMRDALSLADQAIAYGGGRLQEAAVRAMLGSVERSVAAAIVQALAARDGVAVLAVVDGLRGRGQSAAGALEELAGLLQQMAVAQAVPGALDADDPDAAEAARLAGALSADETQLLYSIAVHGRGELPLLNDEYAALTMVLLRFLAFPPLGPGAAAEVAPATGAAAALRSAAADAPAQPAAPAQPVAPACSAAAPAAANVALVSAKANAVASKPVLPEPPAWLDAVPDDAGTAASDRAAGVAASTSSEPPHQRATEALQPTVLGQRWATLVATLNAGGAITALVRELAMQAEWLAEDTGCVPPRWRLRVEREALRTAALRDKLQAAVSAAQGHAVELELIDGVALDSPALRDAAARARAQRQAEQAIQADPLVREVMSQFSTARIVPGSIKPNPRNLSP